MPEQGRARRRIDRVADEALLHRVTELDIGDLRVLRDDCRAEEASLSYARRVLQARLDIARAEMARRAGDSETAESLVAALPSILADVPSPHPRDARHVAVHTPDEPGRRQADALLQDASLGRMPDLDDAAVADLVARFESEERAISELRSRVLRNLDGLQAELVRRYRSGEVAVDDVVRAAVPPRSPGQPSGELDGPAAARGPAQET
jgi:hypothetical protein